jgi:hypothetical protein
MGIIFHFQGKNGRDPSFIRMGKSGCHVQLPIRRERWRKPDKFTTERQRRERSAGNILSIIILNLV